MKIIKKGTKTLPEEKVYIKKCRICGCVFTYKINEMREMNSDGAPGVICPQCNYFSPSFIRRRYKEGKE